MATKSASDRPSGRSRQWSRKLAPDARSSASSSAAAAPASCRQSISSSTNTGLRTLPEFIEVDESGLTIGVEQSVFLVIQLGKLLRNQQVSGSSPLSGSNRINNLQGFSEIGKCGCVGTM
ncbi:MAG: hypothetical protein OXG04_19535 [Acidobacteria bacterium]|nr:hypothetical protein [Acidobacteriota bacterium]